MASNVTAPSLLQSLNLHLLAYGMPPSEFAFALNFPESPDVHSLHSDKIPNFTMKAIPAFFLAVFIEFLTGVALGKKLYRLNDSLMSLMLGSISLLTGLVWKTLQISSYLFVYDKCRIFSFAVDGWPTWIGLLLGCDLAYYWMHREAHTYHFMFNGHSVHHSGEDYNLSTALRQGALQGLFSPIFFLPLAVIGFHPACYLGHSMLNTLGQFWIHTKLIGDLGPLEYVLNTPSHHRVHHRIPGNCNYGGVLIIWDRMFGTFQAETEQVEHYGLAVQYKTFDPVLANVRHGLRIVSDTEGWSKLFKKRANHPWVFDPLAIFRPLYPSKEAISFRNWVPTDGESDAKRPKLNNAQHPLMSVHCVVHFLLVLVMTLGFLVTAVKDISVSRASIFCIVLLWFYRCLGRLFDVPSWWGNVEETLRLALFLLVAVQHRSKISDGKYSSHIIYSSCLLAVLWFAAMRANWRTHHHRHGSSAQLGVIEGKKKE